MTPKPVFLEPGSSPRMRTLAARTIRTGATATTAAFATVVVCPAAYAAGSNARQDLVRDLGIGVDALYVVEVVECFEKLHHRLRGLAVKGDDGGGSLGDS